MMIRTIIAVSFFMFGIFIFGMSYHNIDLAFNMAYGAIDINAYGYLQDRVIMHLNGLAGMNISAILLILGFTLLFADIKALKGIKWHGTA